MFKYLAVLFSKLSTWFRLAMLKGKKFLKSEIPTALAIVEAIKAVVESPAMPLLTKLIPGTVDDAVAQNLKVWLPKVLASLHIIYSGADRTDEEIVQLVINKLKTMPKADRRGKYLELASKISEYLVDGKLTWAEINVLVQTAYDVQVKNR